MANLFGKNMSRNDIRKRTGDISQFADMRMMTFEEGKARGMRSIECKNVQSKQGSVLTVYG